MRQHTPPQFMFRNMVGEGRYELRSVLRLPYRLQISFTKIASGSRVQLQRQTRHRKILLYWLIVGASTSLLARREVIPSIPSLYIFD